MADTPSQAEHLRLQRELLLRILQSVSTEKLENRVAEKWSAREQLAHLARHQRVFLSRLQTILNEDRPEIPRYDANADEEWPVWAALPLEEIQLRWQADRQQFASLVERFSEKELQRTGKHATMGWLTLSEWIDFFLVHEAHHLYSIFKLSRA